MICPKCQKEPLSRTRFIWKAQVLTLTCMHCGSRLKMAKKTLTTAVFMVAMGGVIVLAMALFVINVIMSQTAEPALVVFVAAGLFALAVIIGYACAVRTVLWNKPYLADPRSN